MGRECETGCAFTGVPGFMNASFDNFRDVLAADISDVLLSDLNSAATYKPAGSVMEYAVSVYVGRPVDRVTHAAEGGRHAANAASHRRRSTMIVAQALGQSKAVEAGSAVGTAGGIVAVKAGDVFIVPGRDAGDPASETVQLRVGEKIDLVEGHWHVEVSL